MSYLWKLSWTNRRKTVHRSPLTVQAQSQSLKQKSGVKTNIQAYKCGDGWTVKYSKLLGDNNRETGPVLQLTIKRSRFLLNIHYDIRYWSPAIGLFKIINLSFLSWSPSFGDFRAVILNCILMAVIRPVGEKIDLRVSDKHSLIVF